MKVFLLFLFPMIILFPDKSDKDSHFVQKPIQHSDIIISVDEWKVPWDDTRSRDPYVAPDGTVFFAGQRDDYIGFFNPETEEFGYHELEDGAGPHTVVVADDGTVWYAGNRARHIGKMDAGTGEITKYRMDDDHARDPHTFAFDKDGNIWFTAQGGNGVGHFNVTTGETKVIAVPTERARPYGIRMDPAKERPWIALFGTNKIATVDPETMQLTEIELPRETIRPRRLDVTSDGNVWYGDYSSGFVGRYNPADGTVTEWEMPDGDISRPYAVLADDK
ncbi:MAG: lyase, partial [Balneolaceae bacterium]